MSESFVIHAGTQPYPRPTRIVWWLILFFVVAVTGMDEVPSTGPGFASDPSGVANISLPLVSAAAAAAMQSVKS